MTGHGGHIDEGLLETPRLLLYAGVDARENTKSETWVSLVHNGEHAMEDKREGPCSRGPCRMPRRCWRFVTCFLYGEGVEMVPGATVTDTSHSERDVSGSSPDTPTNIGV